MSGEKTEPPSQKKLRQAREEGNVAKSKDFSSGILFILGAWILGGAGPAGVEHVKVFMRRCFQVGVESSGRLEHIVVESAREGAIMMLIVIAPLLGGLVVIGLLVGFAQTGGLFTLKVLQLKLDKLNPVTGIKNNFFSSKAYVELLKSLAKLGVAGYLGYSVIETAIREVTLTQKLPVTHSVSLAAGLVAELIKKIGAFLIVIGFADLLWQRYSWTKGLMQSKQEQKDEYKQAEGDPQMKGKRKQMAKELANQKGIKAVKQAKVVVTNPHEIAVALEYEPEDGMEAPQILCKGERVVAQQIIEEAEKHGIPIMQNIALAHSLNECEIGDEVPEDLYEAIAEVLNWVYAMEAGGAEAESESDWDEEDEDW
ncbi:flagellar biosynthesis protein FlhB [Planctomycetota bacterium]